MSYFTNVDIDDEFSVSTWVWPSRFVIHILYRSVKIVILDVSITSCP